LFLPPWGGGEGAAAVHRPQAGLGLLLRITASDKKFCIIAHDVMRFCVTSVNVAVEGDMGLIIAKGLNFSSWYGILPSEDTARRYRRHSRNGVYKADNEVIYQAIVQGQRPI
jgi:hypothetical protein